MSTKINFGNISLNWKGLYVATTRYKKDDIVLFKRSAYIALQESVGISPTTTTHWGSFALGLSGLSAAGDLLVQGENGLERLALGAEKNILAITDGKPSWRLVNSGTPFEDLPESFFTPLGAEFRVDKLAKMGLGASEYYRTYLMADGSIKAVGAGSNYQNGDPHGSNIFVPSRVNADTAEVRFKEVFSGSESNYAIDTDDNVWSWGGNSDGQLGHGNTTNLHTAKKIEYFSDNNIKIKYISPGNTTIYRDKFCAFFLTTDGKVYGCGNNESGQLGDSTTTKRTEPVRCGALESIIYIYATVYQTAVYAIDSSGTLWAWGANLEGQLGIGNTSNQTFPQRITALTNVKKVVGGNGSSDNRDVADIGGYAIAIQNDGTLWGTGYNSSGQLGLGDTTQRYSWTRAITSVKFKDIACSVGLAPSAAGISTDGKLYVWGGNDNGQLGDGTTTNKYVPTLSTDGNANNVTKILFGGESFYGLSSHGNYTSLYFQAGNMIYAAGDSQYGNLGTGSRAEVNSSFAPVIGISGTIKDWTIYGRVETFGLSILYDDGRVDAGGWNTYGQTGTQTTSLHHLSTLKNVLFI